MFFRVYLYWSAISFLGDLDNPYQHLNYIKFGLLHSPGVNLAQKYFKHIRQHTKGVLSCIV